MSWLQIQRIKESVILFKSYLNLDLHLTHVHLAEFKGTRCLKRRLFLSFHIRQQLTRFILFSFICTSGKAKRRTDFSSVLQAILHSATITRPTHLPANMQTWKCESLFPAPHFSCRKTNEMTFFLLWIITVPAVVRPMRRNHAIAHLHITVKLVWKFVIMSTKWSGVINRALATLRSQRYATKRASERPRRQGPKWMRNIVIEKTRQAPRVRDEFISIDKSLTTAEGCDRGKKEKTNAWIAIAVAFMSIF